MSNYSDHSERTVGAPEGVLALHGEITINTVSALDAQLRTALETGSDIRLDFAAVSEIDLSAIQLLWAARRAADGAGHRFSLIAPLPVPIQECF